jgi:hypothetical protein
MPLSIALGCACDPIFAFLREVLTLEHWFTFAKLYNAGAYREREDVLKFASVLKVEGEEAKAVILF